MKKSTTKLTALTAYDASFAKIFDACGIDIILVGDSLGNVIKGCENTLCVTMEDVEYHTQNVAKSCENALIIADMPANSYNTPKQALANAQRLLGAGASMIKIEGGKQYNDVFQIFKKHNIRTCGHLGLLPQSVETMGYKIQGKTQHEAELITQDALFLESIGVELLVLECIPSGLAKDITQLLTINTIGIGAGPYTNGQILVSYDMIGVTSAIPSAKLPKFVRNFGEHCGVIQATRDYIDAVKNLKFPNTRHSY
jgi:3-methyl-2-oxobutanoate hydroxymethyltransferase